MDRSQRADGFDFHEHEHRVFHKPIKTVSTIELNVAVENRSIPIGRPFER